MVAGAGGAGELVEASGALGEVSGALVEVSGTLGTSLVTSGDFG